MLLDRLLFPCALNDHLNAAPFQLKKGDLDYPPALMQLVELLMESSSFLVEAAKHQILGNLVVAHLDGQLILQILVAQV